MPSSTVAAVAKGSGKRAASLSQSARRARPAAPVRPPAQPRWDVEQSRSARSAWIWRGFLLMSLMALGIAIVLIGHGHRYQTFGILWGVIAAGWFAISMWLWRKHSQYMKS
jgi:hypothetical protein